MSQCSGEHLGKQVFATSLSISGTGSKARDAYDFDTNFIKTHINGLIKPITMLVNQSISTREVPSSWKVATVIDKAMMSNYRPISILPCVSNGAFPLHGLARPRS